MLISLSLLALTACQDMSLPVIPTLGGEKELAKIDGPDVPAVKDSMQANAEMALKRGDYKGAGQLYKQWMDSDPKSMKAKIGYAESLRRANENDKAITLFDTVLDAEPKNIEALEGKGVALMNKGEYVEAGKQFASVMAVDPKRWRTLNGIGILFVTRTMNDEAVAYFDEALVHSPNNASVLNNKGLTLAIDRYYDQSVETLKRAARAAQSNKAEVKQIDLNRAMVLAISGDMDGAEQVASSHLSGPALYNNLGIYAHLAKDDSMAKSYLNMALAKSPTFYERAWENLDSVLQVSRSSFTGKSVKVKSGKVESEEIISPEDAEPAAGGQDEEKSEKKSSSKKSSAKNSGDFKKKKSN